MDANMALFSSPNPTGGGRRPSFTPTAIEFTPKLIETKREVLKASFVTQTIPNAHIHAGIIGLCTVPEERADMNDLGWHIADFLAFRALLCGKNSPKAQSWLTMCDIPTLVGENPERYVHGKERRLVGFAARPQMHQMSTGLVEREDNIQVETSAEALKDMFIAAVKKKLAVLKKHKYPLLLIICGPTSMEQDIYFGKLSTDRRYTMKELRYDIGDNINHIEATVITASLFSAGWQTNTSFGHPNPMTVRGNRVEFLARQFGGLFAQNLVHSFLGWKCPALDETKVDPQIQKTERFPGPASPSEELRALTSQLEIKIQSYLVGELSTFHMDHSFSFNKSKDEWEVLIGPREGSSYYRSLDWYERKWNELSPAQSLVPTDEGFPFLGSAFGGSRTSQLNHIKYLIEESYLAWPDHWASNFGQETKKDFERFMNINHPDNLDCHEIFNVLEHRARMSILGDTIVQYFDLPMPDNERCRDWDNQKWKQNLSATDRDSLIRYFGTILACVPGPNVPPGVNPNNLSKLQRRLESSAGYVRASLLIRFLTSKNSSEIAVDRIESFLREIKVKQAELLASNLEIYQMCCCWLNAINMPVRKLDNAVTAIKTSQGVAGSEDTIEIPDCNDEYDVYKEDNGYFGSATGSTVVENPHDKSLDSQQLSTLPVASVAMIQEHKAITTERTEDILIQPGQAANAGTVVTQTLQDNNAELSQEEVALAIEETRLIMELQITNERAKRQKLVTELSELLKRSENLTPGVKANQPRHVYQGNSSGAASDKVVSTLSFTEVEGHAAREREDEERRLEQKRVETATVKEQEEIKPLEGLEKDSLHLRKEGEGITRRQTPPHLRGIRGARRS